MLSLGIRWLVLKNDTLIAIPEPFIQALIENGILPIVRMSGFQIIQKPPPDFELLIKTYSSWGIQYIQLFDRPNTSSFWGVKAWSDSNLVERFIDLFLPYAELFAKYQLHPIFPTLEVGSGFWDIAFLRFSLESIVRRRHQWLVDRLILSAYIDLYDPLRPLNWGAGGQERYPNSRPFQIDLQSQDHRGLYIADWYETIAKAIVGKTLPIMLMDDAAKKPINMDGREIQQRTLYAFQRLVDPRQNEIIEIEGLPYDPLRDEILCLNFYSLADENSPDDPRAWYSASGQAQGIANAVKTYWEQNGLSNGKQPSFHHALLLPQLEAEQIHQELEKRKSFLIQYQPKVVFNLQDALQAKHVWYPKELINLSETELFELENHACILHPFTLDGISIASHSVDSSLEVL